RSRPWLSRGVGVAGDVHRGGCYSMVFAGRNSLRIVADRRTVFIAPHVVRYGPSLLRSRRGGLIFGMTNLRDLSRREFLAASAIGVVGLSGQMLPDEQLYVGTYTEEKRTEGIYLLLMD